jgi:hypothetical protein
MVLGFFLFSFSQARTENYWTLKRKGIMATSDKNCKSEEIVPSVESVRSRNIQQKLIEHDRVKAFGNVDKMECASVTGREITGLSK